MLNLSLSGCGFLGIYHIGVISAFREHAPEIIQNSKISGCSAGSLVAACAVSDCCLGQMVSDVLEIALKARSHALGPLHPSFNIVDILRNGLRRILPVDAHKLCTNRVHISLTRWKDGKNFLVNQFDSREELIQALLCSSFVPCYSGFLPPKFKGTYYWDGGLSNNNPILDQDTILVSPFGGEADICPRDESASYYCYDFQGTNLQWSYENVYRISKALFPPNPQILKAMCFRGYKDAINFLKSRNLLQCSCYRLREKTSISSVIGEDINVYSIFDENELEDSSLYDSEEDNINQYAQSKQPLNYQEMPTSVCEILDAACDDNKGIINYVYDSQLTRAISIAFLPWTLPFEFSFSFTKRVLELIPKINVSPNSSSLIDTLLLFINYIIHKFTYDRYQYHSRVTCKLCNIHSNRGRNNNALQYNMCHHGSNDNSSLMHKNSNVNNDKFSSYDEKSSNNLNSLNGSRVFSNAYYPKLCARHRVPSICSSETGGVGSVNGAQYRFRKSRRNRSYVSNTSDLASSVDLNEYKLSKTYSYSRRRNYDSYNEGSISSVSSRKLSTSRSKKSIKSFEKLKIEDKNESMELKNKIQMLFNSQDLASKIVNAQNVIITSHNANTNTNAPNIVNSTTNRVHFHLNHSDEDNDKEINSKVVSNESINFISESSNQKFFNSSTNSFSLTNSKKTGPSPSMAKLNEKTNKIVLFNEANNNNSTFNSSSTGPIITEPDDDSNINPDDSADKSNFYSNLEPLSASSSKNTSNSEESNTDGVKDNMEWESYWDNLELNAIGRVNINI